uniref:Secreted protein n=1 Tax=Ascaris lumbricoides TaxID=6252 RepID=A0A0M3IBJ6_ASCLU
MQWPFSFVIFVELLSHSMMFSQCVDGINNVILIEDIGGDDSTIKFHEVQMLSYSLKKTPRCTGGSPSVKFPGYLKAHKEDSFEGKVEISRAIKTEQGRLIAQLTLKQDSFLLGEICNRGRSVKYVSADT